MIRGYKMILYRMENASRGERAQQKIEKDLVGVKVKMTL